MSSVNYQDKLFRLSSGIADVLSSLNYIVASHTEVTEKKTIRALGIKSRVKELNTIKAAIDLVQDKMNDLLSKTSCKSYINYCKNSNDAEHRHTLRNKEFESVSRNMFAEYDKSAYRQMVMHLFPTESNKPVST